VKNGKLMSKIVRKLKAASGKKVLIIGDVMIDEYLFGNVDRISPEAPVPVLKEERREWCLGGAANVAINCKKLGCDVQVIALIGEGDAAGKKLSQMFVNNGMKTNGLVRSSHRPTIRKQRLMASNHQLLRIDSESNISLSDYERTMIVNRIDDMMTDNMIVLISDYAKGTVDREVVLEVVSRAKQRSCTVLVDPKGPHFDKYYGVDYIKPNLKEFKQMVDCFSLPSGDSEIRNGKKICELLSLRGLVVTSPKGMQFISKNSEHFSPAYERDVFDVTGAGDTVLSFLALGLGVLPMYECLAAANKAASVAISHIKTYAVSLDELLDDFQSSKEKVFRDWSQLKEEIDVLKERRKKIVFTNGCFDLMHAGHIYILEEAKRRGDILVVAVNTDSSIRRLKGPSRPVKTLSERLRVMAAIGVVDFVVQFDQDTPGELIEYLKPDVIAKGSGYMAEEVVGYKTVTAYGGRVEIIGEKMEFSTTDLVERMQR
jgi:D-beta-D-heptose 7-phosphate kinase / D-beta-D-heptose 1-phosphate adenosyltransferase